jgi:DNA-binding GntR family transcriptional regulator
MQITRPTPIVDQVDSLLRDRIRAEHYPPGGRLPSETELSEELGVSRATIRTVLARLAVEGLILRKQGDGTYINQHIRAINTHSGGMWDFARLIASSGFEPVIQTISMSVRAADDLEADILAIEAGEDLFSIVRLFSAGDTPAILAKNVLPLHLIKQPLNQINGRLRIGELLARYCHQKIAYTLTDISSTTANPEAVELLSVPAGSPLLVLQVTFYNRNNHPIVYGRSYFNDSLLQLRLVQAWAQAG